MSRKAKPAKATLVFQAPTRAALTYKPDGPVGAATQALVEWRANVREVARRWCDNPEVIGDTQRSCEDCQACEAKRLILAGLA